MWVGRKAFEGISRFSTCGVLWKSANFQQVKVDMRGSTVISIKTKYIFCKKIHQDCFGVRIRCICTLFLVTCIHKYIVF